jgi:hypothetical protein
MDPRWNPVTVVERVKSTGLKAQLSPHEFALVSAVGRTWSICIFLYGTWVEEWSHTDPYKLIADMQSLVPDYDAWQPFSHNG